MAAPDSGRNWNASSNPPLELEGEEDLLLNFERVAKNRVVTPSPTANRPQATQPPLDNPLRLSLKVKVPPVNNQPTPDLFNQADTSPARKSERLAGKPKKSFTQEEKVQSEEEKSDGADEDEEEYEEDGVQYCICRSTYSGGFMIACDVCEEWFHGPCVKITQKEAENIESYHCANCEKAHGPSVFKNSALGRSNKRQKSAHENGEPGATVIVQVPQQQQQQQHLPVTSSNSSGQLYSYGSMTHSVAPVRIQSSGGGLSHSISSMPPMLINNANTGANNSTNITPLVSSTSANNVNSATTPSTGSINSLLANNNGNNSNNNVASSNTIHSAVPTSITTTSSTTAVTSPVNDNTGMNTFELLDNNSSSPTDGSIGGTNDNGSRRRKESGYYAELEEGNLNIDGINSNSIL